MTATAIPLLLVLAALLSTAQAQLTGIGRCPEVQPVQGFDSALFEGKWYEYKRYYTSFELSAKCVTVDFATSQDDTSSIDIQASLTNFWTRKETSAAGTAKLTGANNAGVFAVNFPDLDATSSTTVQILDTDYKDYAVAWSCSSFLGVFHKKLSWQLTREKSPGRDITNKINAALKKNSLSTLSYVKTLQSCDN